MWSKLFSLCPEDIFEEILFFFTKSSKFSVVFRFWGKNFGLLAKIIWSGCQNCFQESMWYFWKSCFLKTTSLNCFFYFWTSGTNFLDFRRNIFDRSSKTAFYVSSGDFWLYCFFYEKLWVFSPSSGCEDSIVEFWSKSFKNFFKTAICA